MSAKTPTPRRSRRSTVRSVTGRIENALPPKWRGVFKYRVRATFDQDPPRHHTVAVPEICTALVTDVIESVYAAEPKSAL